MGPTHLPGSFECFFDSNSGFEDPFSTYFRFIFRFISTLKLVWWPIPCLVLTAFRF